MSYQIVYTDAGEIFEPKIHDSRLRGLLLTNDNRLFVSIFGANLGNKCLVLHGVEKLRCDDFRQGNIVLDVTVSSGDSIEIDDLAYAYGVDKSNAPFLHGSMDRLQAQKSLVVRLNSSYGCSFVSICQSLTVEDDPLPL